MTDISSDVHMGPSVRRATGRGEYYAYFAIIFAATLPLACLAWALKAARRMQRPDRGPVRSAWSQAQIITPMIFAA